MASTDYSLIASPSGKFPAKDSRQKRLRSNKLSRKRVPCIQNYVLVNGSHKKVCRIQNRCRNINYILKLKTNNKTSEFYSGRAMLQKSMQPQMNRLIQGDTAVS